MTINVNVNAQNPTAIPTREAEIPRALSEARGSIENLNKLIEELEIRLAPAMHEMAEEPKVSANALKTAIGSELSFVITGTYTAISKINSILSRLEL